MKRLDQVDEDDLAEFHAEMVGEGPFDLLSLFQADALNAEEELLEKEFYEQCNRHQDQEVYLKRVGQQS